MPAPVPAWLESLAFDVNPDFVAPLCPRLGETVRLSLRLWKDAPVRKVLVYLRTDGDYISRPMTRVAEGRRFATWALEVPASEPALRFALVFDSTEGAFFVNKAGVTRYTPTNTGEYVVRCDERPPLWYAEGATYQIFPDRFARARRTRGVKTGAYAFDGGTTREMAWDDRPLEYREGHCLDFFNGDLDGVRKRVPYLAELGVKTLYLTPIFAARTVHRYDCIDYFHVDPNLGGDAALRRLCEAVHAAGLRIVVDVSINHTGADHPWAVAARSDPGAPEAAFYFRQPDGTLAGWFDVPSLPQLDYRSARLRKLVWEGRSSVVRKWLRPPYAIDGWRFDVGHMTGRRGPDQLGHEVFRGVRQAAKAENPDCLLLAEHWQDAAEHLQGDQWDGIMNYAACSRPLRDFCGERDRFIDGKWPHAVATEHPLSGHDVVEMIRAHYARMPYLTQHLVMNVLDSHDQARLHTFEALYEPGLYRGVLCAQFLLPGSPSVYYGDEVGIDGWVATVEGCRFPMPWDPRRWRPQFVELYRALIQLRAREPALQLGALRFLHVDDDRLVLGRFLGDTALVALVSRSDRAARLQLDAARHAIAALEPALAPSPGTSAAVEGDALVLEAGPRGSGIWRARLEP